MVTHAVLDSLASNSLAEESLPLNLTPYTRSFNESAIRRELDFPVSSLGSCFVKTVMIAVLN